MAGSVALTLRNDGRFSPVRVAYRTKYVDSNAHGASASPHACLRYTSGAVAGAIVVKENVFFVGATTGRPHFVKEIFGLLLLSFYGGWTGDQ